VLCPVDFSAAAGRALTNAIMLARRFKADLTVLYVTEDLSNIYPGRPLIDPTAQGSYAGEQLREFQAFLADYDFSDVRWQKMVRHGEPYKEILSYVRETGCQLMVMGSEGRTGLSRLLLGSVAEKVVRELPCSIITVKAEGLTS